VGIWRRETLGRDGKKNRGKETEKNDRGKETEKKEQRDRDRDKETKGRCCRPEIEGTGRGGK
jgi:hypothetical protein